MMAASSEKKRIWIKSALPSVDMLRASGLQRSWLGRRAYEASHMPFIVRDWFRGIAPPERGIQII
jgi:hypothetical protein